MHAPKYRLQCEAKRMILYASRTGTRRNLQALRSAGWRLLVSPAGCVRNEGFPYALDNGAWTYHQQKRPFDDSAFLRAVEKLGQRADWLVIPDQVGNAPATLDLAQLWWPRLRGLTLLLLALQDGMTESDVKATLRPGMGLFLGGSDTFKEQSAAPWGAFARAHSLYFHVGRVNTARRIRICMDAGADSCDGTSATRFADTIGPLTRASMQQSLFGQAL